MKAGPTPDTATVETLNLKTSAGMLGIGGSSEVVDDLRPMYPCTLSGASNSQTQIACKTEELNNEETKGKIKVVTVDAP